MFGKGGSGLETDLRNWARKMGIMPDGNTSDIIKKLVFAFYTNKFIFAVLYVIGTQCLISDVTAPLLTHFKELCILNHFLFFTHTHSLKLI